MKIVVDLTKLLDDVAAVAKGNSLAPLSPFALWTAVAYAAFDATDLPDKMSILDFLREHYRGEANMTQANALFEHLEKVRIPLLKQQFDEAS
jgi:hypothetical protein